MMTYLFSDAPGRADVTAIDRIVDTLPGLGGLALMQKAAKRFGVRADRATA